MSETTDYLLGKLVEGVDGLRRDITDMRQEFDVEQQNAHESRKDVHRKIDELTHRVAQTESAAQITGQVIAQTRDKIGGLEVTLAQDIKPTVDEFKRIKLMGHGVIWAVGVAGAGLGLSAAWWGEQVIGWLRHLLRIP